MNACSAYHAGSSVFAANVAGSGVTVGVGIIISIAGLKVVISPRARSSSISSLVQTFFVWVDGLVCEARGFSAASEGNATAKAKTAAREKWKLRMNPPGRGQAKCTPRIDVTEVA